MFTTKTYSTTKIWFGLANGGRLDSGRVTAVVPSYDTNGNRCVFAEVEIGGEIANYKPAIDCTALKTEDDYRTEIDALMFPAGEDE